MDLITRVIKMGITSYKDKSRSNSEIDEYFPEQLRVCAEATVRDGLRELDALLPPKQGDTKSDEDVGERLYEFMKAGSCKESFTVLNDCMDETQSFTKCRHHLPALRKCMNAHSDYYQPIHTLGITTLERFSTDLVAFLHPEQDVSERKQNEQETLNLILGEIHPFFS